MALYNWYFTMFHGDILHRREDMEECNIIKVIFNIKIKCRETWYRTNTRDHYNYTRDINGNYL